MGYKTPQDIHHVARAMIRHKARKLARQCGFTESDCQDIEQELALQSHVASRRFDACKSTAATFYDRILSNRIRDIVESRNAQRRDWRRQSALNDQTPALAATGNLDFQIDLDDALANLSVADRAVATLLMTHDGAEAARIARLTRGKLRSAKGRIAERLIKAGLAP